MADGGRLRLGSLGGPATHLPTAQTHKGRSVPLGAGGRRLPFLPAERGRGRGSGLDGIDVLRGKQDDCENKEREQRRWMGAFSNLKRREKWKGWRRRGRKVLREGSAVQAPPNSCSPMCLWGNYSQSVKTLLRRIFASQLVSSRDGKKSL